MRDTMMGSARDFDILVIGGGPAGSTVASLLSSRGWRVGLLEKDRHPRFHIGESLLPWNVPIFERLGVLEQVKRIAIPKFAADFSVPESAEFVRADFSKALPPTPPSAFQVKRAELDHLLLQNAAARGVEVVEGACVTDIDLDRGGRVHLDVSQSDGARSSWRARFLVDASGRDTILGRQLGIKKRHPKHKSAAIYGHFENVERRTGRDAGNISIYWFRYGWIWMIPLSGGVMSVGVVAPPSYFQHREAADSAFETALALCPPAMERMAAASRIGDLTATGNYSYYCDRMYGRNHVILGDAFAFVDPVFSSGVYIAMSGAEGAAEAIDTWLGDAVAGARRFRKLERRIRGGIDRLWWLIDRFNEPTLRRLFMRPVNLLGVRTAVLSTLAGDIFGNWRLSFPLLVFRVIYGTMSLLQRETAGSIAATQQAAPEQKRVRV